MTNYEKLISTLKEVFMLDKAELDFGIYRIMNQKRKDIENFLEKDLLPQVQQVLQQHISTDKQAIQKKLDEAVQQLLKFKVDPDSSEDVRKLKEQLAKAADVTALENEVFSHLANFFKRYFDNGDFISQRRYKKDVYSIPYEGEEVKLYWANYDQYYIKTGEYFKNYRFRLSENKYVSFELVSASTEQNNNKAQEGKERRFALYTEKPVEVKNDTLCVYFTYEPMDKKVKREDLLQQAFDVLKNKIPADFLEVLKPDPTPANKTRTLLQKHLNEYTARNTFDYFIHKDLGNFLKRELDFYIKNEVLFIDDINTRNETEFLQQLSQLKAIKTIGEKIILFLAQLEDFQKKLWLKKKFVVETNYCITLDRVPKELYSGIASNKAQIEEWIKLFTIDEIKNSAAVDMFGKAAVGFSQPLKTEFLEQNPYLVLDTAFFDEEFKYTLLQGFNDIDEELDGLLIHSENFQALQLLQEKYKEQIKCIYIDPPYNTAASEILYKNDFKHSAWISLIENRVGTIKELLEREGILSVAIDDSEFIRLRFLLEDLGFKTLGLAAIRNNPAGRSTAKGFSIAHEYTVFSSIDDDTSIGRLQRSEKQLKRYDKTDESGAFEWVNFRKHGGENANKFARPKLFYPIFANVNSATIRIPNMNWQKEKQAWVLDEKPSPNEVIVYPVNGKKEEKTWKWGSETTSKCLEEFCVRPDQNGEIGVYVKSRLNDEGTLPLTWWDKKEYSSTEYGTNLLQKVMGTGLAFSFPKSIFAVEDCLRVSNVDIESIVLDFFAGSGTTGHAVINLNREDNGKRKYILVEMGEYFDTVTKPRIQKVIYSKDWKDGKPVSRQGSSHCFKYIRLESYEDTLNNLQVRRTKEQELALQESHPSFKEGYLLQYMLNVETRDSLLNTEWFVNPFNFRLNITRNNETKPVAVDLVETFNYLIGLKVKTYSRPKPGYVAITGTNRKEETILIVWRDCNQHNSAALNEFLKKSKYNPLDNEFHRIYVNGDNNVENLKTGEEQWKVVLIEEEFKRRMFE